MPSWHEQILQDTVVWDEVYFWLLAVFSWKQRSLKTEQILKKNMTIFGFELKC